MYGMSRETQAGINGFSIQMRVVFQYLINSLTITQFFNNKLDSNPRSPDDRLTNHDGWISGNVILPFYVSHNSIRFSQI